MTFAYVDPSPCGSANVTVPKTAPIDCTGQPCAGAVTTNRAEYTCSNSIQVTLVDSDLTGQPSTTVSVSSTLESTPEPLVLTAVGDGTFTGTIPTTSAPASPDGRLSG